MQYNFKKHYYDPYDSLDAEWKARISHEMLSVGEAAQLSGFSRQDINIEQIIVTKICSINLMNSFYSSVRPNNPSAYRCQQGLRPDGLFRAAHHHG